MPRKVNGHGAEYAYKKQILLYSVYTYSLCKTFLHLRDVLQYCYA